MLIGGRQTARSPATEPFACARASCSRRSWTGLQGRARAKPIRGGNASCQVQPDTRTPKEPVSARSTTTKISGSRAVRSTRGRGSHPRKAGHLALPARAWGQRDRAARDTSSPLDSQPQRMARRGYRIRGGVNIRRGRNPRLASGYDRTVILGQRHPLQLGICTQPSVFQAKPMRPATTDPLADQADGTGRRSPRTGSAAAIPSESRGNPVSRLSAPVVCAQTRMWQPKGTGRGSGWEPRAHNLPWTRP